MRGVLTVIKRRLSVQYIRRLSHVGEIYRLFCLTLLFICLLFAFYFLLFYFFLWLCVSSVHGKKFGTRIISKKMISLSWLAAVAIFAGMMPSTPPPGTMKKGCCGITDTGGNCDVDSKGSWNTTVFGIKDISDCVGRCRKCRQCSYVSFNLDPEHEDCSWYNDQECDMRHLMHVSGYISEYVKPRAPPGPPTDITVAAPLTAAPTRNVSTIATIEVDVMPFLGRKSNGKTAGGPHDKAFHWLSQLGADMVRFAPWFPNPKLVVAELHPPDCSRNRTSWDPSLLDQIYADFAQSVGPHTVAMQLSTLPSWMFTDGMNISGCPESPWEPCMRYGRQGGRLRDPSCGEVARYIASLTLTLIPKP